MPLTLPSFNFAIICDENELETYDVKQETLEEGPDSMTAFVASEAGKQFRIVITNNLSDFDLILDLHIDGKRISGTRNYVRAGHQGKMQGIHNSDTTRLPFKFQELEVVDPALEHAPISPEMGTIEVRAFRCQALHLKYLCKPSHSADCGLHEGRVSERSKKAGWHHVSTADAVPTGIHKRDSSKIVSDRIDPIDAPCASIKVFYRPRDLLMAQGVIAGHNVGAEISGESAVNDRKRVREDESPGPSKRRTRLTIKKEEIDSRVQQIRALQQALQAELDSLMDERSSVKHERSPSPIVVGKAAGKAVDLTGN